MKHSPEYRRILNRMGYYAYQSGLIFRHIGQEGEWDEHCSRCRNFILKAIDLHNPSRITVLGSGWLLDLPLAEMAQHAEKIFLADIVHPPEVIKQAGNLSNVELLEVDITGGMIEEVWEKTRGIRLFKKKISVKDFNVPDFDPWIDPGMVISLNIMTQLENLPANFLMKKTKADPQEILQFRKKIQEKHLAFLMKHQSVLLTDISEIFTEKTGGEIISPTLLTQVPAGLLNEEWTWNFDLRNGDYYNTKSIMKVIAVAF